MNFQRLKVISFVGIQIVYVTGCLSFRSFNNEIHETAYPAEYLLNVYISKDLKYGYVTTSGKMVAHGYDRVGPFSEGRAWARANDTLYLIDSKMNVIFERQIEGKEFSTVPFFDGASWLIIDNDYLLVSKYGEIIPMASIEEASEFNEGLARIRIDGKYGFSNTDGEIVIDCEYFFLWPFSEGLAGFSTEDQLWGYINKAGQIVIEPQFSGAQLFREGLTQVRKNKKWFYVDVNGQPVFDMVFDSISEFVDGLADVGVEGKSGLINKEGQWVTELPPRYTRAQLAGEGLILVRNSNHEYGYLNTEGTMRIRPKFSDASFFYNGFARVRWRRSGKLGFINSAGAVIWKSLDSYGIRPTTLASYRGPGYREGLGPK